MKVVHVITRLILGGAQENTVLTCEGLLRKGHEVTLITGPPLGPEGELLDRAMAGGYRVIVIEALQRPIHPVRDRESFRALVRYFDELKPDIMHSHSSKAGILARRAAAHSNVPMIVHTIHGLPFHPHQPWWLNRLYIALERRAARQTDCLISVADSMTAQALAAGVGEPGKFATIYSGMESASFAVRPPGADGFRKALDLPDGAVLVTQVARLAELKGQEYLIEAAARLAPNVYVCLVGDGALREQFRRQIAELGLTDRFRLTGLLDPKEIPAVMHASDIIAHCSLHEGLARTLPQAHLARRPVVAFDVDGAPEAVVNGRSGYLVEPKDVDGLVRAVEELAGDEARRREMGLAGYLYVKDRFDAQTMVDCIDDLYEALASAKGYSHV